MCGRWRWQEGRELTDAVGAERQVTSSQVTKPPDPCASCSPGLVPPNPNPTHTATTRTTSLCAAQSGELRKMHLFNNMSDNAGAEHIAKILARSVGPGVKSQGRDGTREPLPKAH